MVTRCTSWAYVAAFLLLTGVSTATAKYSGGTGEPNDPYQIATAADLIALGETPADYDKHFILTADIDLDPSLPGRKVFDKAVIAPDTNPNDPYIPFQGTAFSGVFDGRGHTISHLTIRGGRYLGLFGLLEDQWWPDNSAGQVENLGLVEIRVTGTGDCVGGLVGENYWGTVIQCRSSGAVNGEDCVGGLVGDNRGFLTECYSTAIVGGNGFVGGLMGANFAFSMLGAGYVLRCYSTGVVNATGSYIGGLVGLNDGDGNVTECYSTGTVTGSGDFVGGLVGCGWAGATAASFWDTQTSGQTTSAGGIGKTTAEMQTESTFTDAGWDFLGETANGSEDIWKIAESLGYPRLAWEKYSGGTGEPNDPYQIATAADLIALGETPEDYDKHFILTADIDLDPNLPGRKVFDKAVIAPDTNDKEDWFQGTPFTGVFDGKGHMISHLTIIGGGNLGLFGQLTVGADVKDLVVVDVNITGSGECVGGLAGSNRGSILASYSTGTVSGNSWVGGLVGENYFGTVIQCRSTGEVNGADCVGGLVGWNSSWDEPISNCYSNASVSGGDHVGGLVGVNCYCTVIRCYSTGDVSGNDWVGGLMAVNNEGSVFECYSTGRVSGNDWVGGLVAFSWGPVAGSFWDTQTSGQSTSGGGTAKTTAEMQTAKTFLDAGWDFAGETANGMEDIWWIDEGKDYPRLWWEAAEE